METYTLMPLVLAFLWACFYFLKLTPKSTTTPPLPPGPRPLPIIGNLHQLSPTPYRTMADFARKYGPVISVKLGMITTVVVSSADAAREMFQKHDLAVSSRTVNAALRAADGHDQYSMLWLPVNPKWRLLRKISTIHLFSAQRLNAGQSLRHKKVVEMAEYVTECSKLGELVDVGKLAFTTQLNLLSNTFFSMDLASHSSKDSQEFKDLVWNIVEEIGKPNLADVFPVVGFISWVSVNRKLMGYGNKFNEVFTEIIRERLSDEGRGNGDVLDTLIKIMKEEGSELSLNDIRHLLMDFFTAGTDPATNTMEWVMTELVRNPEKMVKAQDELERVLGRDTKSIQESDIPKLPYLQAVVKEALRMHPPTVFLVPRKADSDIELCGYLVPKNAQVFVNLWAISYDPSTWENPEKFLPERFLDQDIDVKGQDYGFLPFGAGRRTCPGMTLAYRMLNLMLGTLLHGFNWKLEDGLSPVKLNMSEKLGITIQKVKPLKLIPIPK